MPKPEPNDFELAELYRTWWKDSYGTVPNSQNVVVAIAFARHVLATYTEQQENQ